MRTGRLLCLQTCCRVFALDVMDLGQQQDSDTQDPVFYPVPHSHWFPRPIAFRAYNPSGGRSQQDAGPRGARRLHIQVSRPVRLTVTLNSHCWYMVIEMEIGFEEFVSNITSLWVRIYLDPFEHARLSCVAVLYFELNAAVSVKHCSYRSLWIFCCN